MKSSNKILQPDDFIRFIELEGFRDDWKTLGLHDDDLTFAQIAIMFDPRKAPIVAGTGGLRKLRYSPKSWKSGKRGAVRIGYVYFEQWRIVLLVIAYAKGDRDDIPAAHRRTIARIVESIETQLANRTIR